MKAALHEVTKAQGLYKEFSIHFQLIFTALYDYPDDFVLLSLCSH